MSADFPAPFSTTTIPYFSDPQRSYQVEWCTKGAANNQVEQIAKQIISPEFRIPTHPARKYSDKENQNPATDSHRTVSKLILDQDIHTPTDSKPATMKEPRYSLLELWSE